MAWMGQKPDPETARPAQPAPVWSPQAASPSLPKETRERMERTQVANIGKSLQINGELSGNEDLTIDGRVTGKISMTGHSLTIGPNGQVSAEIHAKSLIVAGEVRGNITAEEKVEIAATGTLLGDVRAPRVVLADGAKFKGSIDMEAKSGSGARPAGSAVSKSTANPTLSDNEPAASVRAAKI